MMGQVLQPMMGQVMQPAVGQMLPPNIGQMMQPGVMQANMGQPIQNQQQKNYGYKPKFYNNGSKKGTRPIASAGHVAKKVIGQEIQNVV